MRLATPLGTSWWIPTSEISVPLGRANMTRTQTGETMKTRAFLKYGAIALLLSVAGSILAIGFLTILLDGFSSRLWPSTSSDLASWIQAIGSIGAIVGAYFLGSKQSRDARTLALELESRRRAEQVDRYKATVGVVRLMATTTISAIEETEYEDFCGDWRRFLQHDLQTALTAFDAMPAHELGTDELIYQAFAVRTAAQSLFDAVRTVTQTTGLAKPQYQWLRNNELDFFQTAVHGSWEGFEAAWAKGR